MHLCECENHVAKSEHIRCGFVVSYCARLDSYSAAPIIEIYIYVCSVLSSVAKYVPLVIQNGKRETINNFC